MKILEEDIKRGTIRLKIENDYDLWVLYTIIVKGDKVSAKTTREIKVRGEKRTTSRRIPMTLTLTVERVEFQPFTGKLRVHGVIIEAPEKFGLKGLHHTISLDIGSELQIMKEKWSSIALKRLKTTLRRECKVLISAIDYDEIAVGILHDYGVRIVYDENLKIPGKDSPSRDKVLDLTLKKIKDDILNLVKTNNIELILVAGPGFLKEKLAVYLKENAKSLSLKVQVRVVNVSTGGSKGVHEVLKRNEILEMLKEIDIARERMLLNEFMKLLVKSPDMIAYGFEDVEKASSIGAISKLMIIDDLIRTYDVELRTKVERIISEVEKYGGTVVIFSSHSESGVELKGLGGIAAILRFKISQ